MASDEENCIRAIAGALSQVSLRLQGEALPPGTTQVSSEEASEFVEMLENMIASAASEERVRMLLFDVDGNLAPTLVSLLRTPYTAVPQGDLSRLLISALRCLTRACTYHSSEGAPQSYLSRLSCDTLVGENGVEALVAMLAEGHPAEVHFSAGELLFSLLVRSDSARRAVVERDLTDSLVRTLAEARSPQARCFVAATLREMANTDATAVLNTPNAVTTLVRCLGSDDAADVRALAAETIDVCFKCDPAAWRAFDGAKALCTAVTSRLEREKSREVLEATLKLLETLFVCDASLANANASFTEYFIAAFGDRLIVAAMSADRRVASLAARSLRLLLQLAPHYRYVAHGLCQHFPSLSTIMRAIVQLDDHHAPLGQGDDAETLAVASQVLGVELSIAFGMMMAQDPRCRDVVRQQLASTPQWMSQLRSAVLDQVNRAALEYFVGVAITDVTGVLLNDPRAVKWEPSGARPMRASVEDVLPSQEARWHRNQDLLPAPTNIGDVDPTQASRLAFVLLGYVVHKALSPEAPGRSPHQAAEQHGFSSPRGDADASNATVPDGHHQTHVKSPTRRLGPHEVSYTKSALLREQRAHPTRTAAERRAELDMPDALPRASAYYEESGHPQQSASRALRDAGRRSTQHADASRMGENPAFTKFDSALKLALRFAQFYNNVGEPQAVVYETDGSFARRQPKNATWFAAATPKAKSWTVEQLKEGDLFFFALPLVGLSSSALEQVRQRAVRHMRYIKNSFTITPQAAKARRWFLFDMLNHIMPGVIDSISGLMELCQLHGDENVKFPVVMFREGDVASDGTLNSGNLCEVLDQVRFYFKSVAPKNADDPAQMATASRGEQLTSQFLKDVESKIHALSNAQFTGNERTFLNFNDDLSSDDDDDNDNYIRETAPASAGVAGGRGRSNRPVYYDDTDDDM